MCISSLNRRFNDIFVNMQKFASTSFWGNPHHFGEKHYCFDLNSHKWIDVAKITLFCDKYI